MGYFSHLFYPWGLIVQGLAVLHFIRRRPDTYWLYIILFIGPPGALIYLLAEAVPDFGLLRGSFKVFPRRKRIGELQGLVQVNPSAGNWEELGDLLAEDGQCAPARSAFDRAIAARGGGGAGDPDVFYRRGACALELKDPAAALPDLEHVVRQDFYYDFGRAAGLLAQAYALTGETAKAETIFRHALEKSSLSETYLNFADLLAAQGRTAEARLLAQQVLDKLQSATGFQRRRERPWTRRARKTLKQLSA